jgi:hypothetical protein
MTNLQSKQSEVDVNCFTQAHSIIDGATLPKNDDDCVKSQAIGALHASCCRTCATLSQPPKSAITSLLGA